MKGPNKTIRRRRIEGKTDYKARLSLISSGKTRLVIRKTNRYIIAQLVQSDIAQDKVLVGVSSKDLLEKGWSKDLQGSLKGLPAAYLTGLLLGKNAKGKVKEAILDMGMYRNVKRSRIYAALKGAIDSGLKVSCSETILPSMEDLKRNEKTAKLFDKLVKSI